VDFCYGFWFLTFYSNKLVMQLSGMRLSGLYCTVVCSVALWLINDDDDDDNHNNNMTIYNTHIVEH